MTKMQEILKLLVISVNKMKETRKFKTKIEALKAFRERLNLPKKLKDEFNWRNPCKCWDGLLVNFINETKNYKGGELFLNPYSKGCHLERQPLYDLGFTFREMQNFEYLIGFGMNKGPSPRVLKQFDFESYENGIEYLNRWIASLEVKQVRYVTVRVDNSILKSLELELN